MAPYAQPPTEVNPPRGFNMIHVKADDPRRGVAAVTHVPVTHVLRCEACGKILCEVANYLWVDAGGLATVDIDSQGLYVIDLAPAKYTVDIRKVGIDRSGDVPKVVEIRANTVTKLDISIDTGIR